MMDELQGNFQLLNGKKMPRVIQKVYNLESERDLSAFLEDDSKELHIDSGKRSIRYAYTKKSGVGLSKLGSSKAISLGAYYYALSQLST